MAVNEIVGVEHLHLHTAVGSLLDGLGQPEEYSEKWKNHGKYLCISDHGMMAAIPRQIKACDKNNLKPIFAIELYVNPLQVPWANDDEKQAYIKTLDPDQMKVMRKSYHLLAVATNEIGYSNLVTLSSLAWINGFYYRPRVNHQQLLQHKEGIIFTSCCYASEVGQAFERGGEEAGFAMIEKYMAMFGENYYLELMLLDFKKQKPYDQFIIKAHDKYKIPLILTNDVHYCNPGDSKFQRYMLMVQTKKTVPQIEQMIQESGDQELFELQDTNLSMKTEEELNAKWLSCYSDVIDYDLFKQAKLNTVAICERAGNVKLDRSLKLPIIDNANEILKEEVVKGYKKRHLPKDKVYLGRVKEELELIFRKGFSSYFLILKQTVDEARRYSMEVFKTPNCIGPGRGSAVGSLVCYCLGVTSVDPIKHDLLFSRFLSDARDDLPDVDTDFLKPVRDYLKDEWAPARFGRDFVANIGSYNTYGIKGALQDMARIFEKDHNEVTALTKALEAKDDDGKLLTWDKAMELYPDLKLYCDQNQEVAEASQKMIHRNRSMGQHAGGIIISSKPINRFVPLVRGKEGEIVSAWAEGLHAQDLGPMGFVKYDWLVITNLEQINYACKLIKERHNLFSICALPGDEDWSDSSFIDDPLAIKMANDADLKGIFQFDSDGIRQLVKKGGVDKFDDLVAYTCLYRPGPMLMKMHDEYVARKKGTKEYTIHPLLQPILGKTHGVITLQEQVMKILHIVGGVPLKDCETLRKAISKKKVEYFKEYKDKFVENGIIKLGWTKEEVENLWQLLEAFSEYAFNASHAVAYSYVSAMLLWLKAHYPLEFYTAILRFESDPDKIKKYRLDAKKRGVIVNFVDLNKSKENFAIVDGQIYMGFSNIKGVGEVVADKIVALQPFADYADFLARFGTEATVLKPLIGLGLFGTEWAEKLQHFKYLFWYKDQKKKRADRLKRYNDRCADAKAEVELLLGITLGDHTEIPTVEIPETVRGNQDVVDEIERIRKSYLKTTDTFNMKTENFGDIATYEQFLKFEFEVEYKTATDKKFVATLESEEACQMQFLGFLWTHTLEKSPDFEGGLTFDAFRGEDLTVGKVECMIQTTELKKSKKNNEYWLLEVEDSNGESGQIQVWEDDWARFGEDLQPGRMVKIELKAPSGGFSRYTLYSPPKHQKYKLPKDKMYDFRVCILRNPGEKD